MTNGFFCITAKCKGFVQLFPNSYRGWGFLTSTCNTQLKLLAYAWFVFILKPLKIWCHLDYLYFHCFIGGRRGRFSFTNKILGWVYLLWSLLWNNGLFKVNLEFQVWPGNEISVCVRNWGLKTWCIQVYQKTIKISLVFWKKRRPHKVISTFTDL